MADKQQQAPAARANGWAVVLAIVQAGWFPWAVAGAVALVAVALHFTTVDELLVKGGGFLDHLGGVLGK